MNIIQRPCNPANYGIKRDIKNIKFIVIHYTGTDGGNALNNGAYFAREKVGASAHYFVDSTAIVQSVPDDSIAWHCGAKRYYHPEAQNHNSIGIELCDEIKNGVIYPTEATIQNAIELTTMLMAKYNIPIDNVIRHWDVSHKLCPAYWCGTPARDALWRSAFWDHLKEVNNMTGEQIYKALNDYCATLPLPEWAERDYNAAVAAGITDGTNPMALIPRYQAAIMAYRALKKEG